VRYPGREGGFDIGDVDLEEVLWELKDQEVILILAPLFPVEELPTICGLCRTPYEGDECPTCRAERELAKTLFDGVPLPPRYPRRECFPHLPSDWCSPKRKYGAGESQAQPFLARAACWLDCLANLRQWWYNVV